MRGVLYFVEGYLKTCPKTQKEYAFSELSRVSHCVLTDVCEILKMDICIIFTLIV